MLNKRFTYLLKSRNQCLVSLTSLLQDRKLVSTAHQMLQDSRTKIELLRMQIVKVNQTRNGDRDATDMDGELFNTTIMGYQCTQPQTKAKIYFSAMQLI